MEILKKTYAIFIDTMQTILLAASIFLVIYIFLFRPFEVSGDSMHPTFKNGEYILTNLISLRFSDPVRGDVIVFTSPTNREKDFIKRVIGMSGDIVLLKEGYVYINGEKLDESVYLAKDVRTYGGSFLKNDESLVVPQGTYFVIGDNRSYSSDSREWGFLKRNDVIGKSFFVYWPINSARLIKNPFEK